MKRLPWKRWCSALCVLALVIGLLPVMSANAEAAAVSSGEAQFERFKSELTALLNNPPEITGNSSGLLGASAAGDDEYESARLLILADESLDTGLLTGAAPILYDGYGMWVAQFRTPAAAKQIANVLNRRGIVAEPDVKVELCGVQDNLKNWTNPNSWGVRYCHIKEFIEKYAPALEGKKAVVAVIDTGTDVNFALLRGKVEKKLSFDSTPNNHGTGVTGIVIDCLYPAQVTVYDYDVGYYDESDKEDKLMDESCLLTCIKAAADDGADVINCSFGGYVSKEVFRSAIEYAISKGSLAVCAAGNDNADMSSYYPAALSYLDGCVAVSAGNNSGKRWVGNKYASNYGAGVELMAPGEQVFSCLANTTDQAKITDGTSLAAPHVSAAAALLKIATGVKTAAELEKLLLTATTSSGKNWIDK